MKSYRFICYTRLFCYFIFCGVLGLVPLYTTLIPSLLSHVLDMGQITLPSHAESPSESWFHML